MKKNAAPKPKPLRNVDPISPGSYLRQCCIVPVEIMGDKPLRLRAVVSGVMLADGGTDFRGHILQVWRIRFRLLDTQGEGLGREIIRDFKETQDERKGYKWLPDAKWGS